MSQDSDIVKEFLIESYDNLNRLDSCLIELEKDPSNTEILADAFRTIHTLKGSSGFLAFSKIESVAHVGEDLLSNLREGKLRLDSAITSGLLSMVDVLRQILSNVETSSKEGKVECAELIARLKKLAQGENAKPIGEILVEKGHAKAEQVEKALKQQEEGDPRHLGEILVEQAKVKPSAVVDALKNQAEVRGQMVSDSNIRVDVSLLDKLMNLVGELVLTRNQIVQFVTTQENATLTTSSQRLNLITTELQEGVMKTRMQPIENIWNKFPRLVRDLATSCGKKVTLEMEGKDTELDRTIIEAIKDPLTHLVRNAVDHGIETPNVRRQIGKPEAGRLFLSAFHEGGQVNIEISDDGGGIDVNRIKRKALQHGFANSDQLTRMSDREIMDLIFLPGFSTAESVTNVSGRGVGMDVVKTNIEKIGGMIDVQSKPGQSTTIKIKIPLTLAIIPALLVTSGGDRYAIPQVNLLELVRLDGKQGKNGVEMIHGSPVYRLRGKLLPLVYLSQTLKVNADSSPASKNGLLNIVVLQADGHPFGLVVEGISDTEEIVVKPLGKLLKGLSVFAGATIMGDGTVALILDVLGIAQSTGVVSEAREKSLSELSAQVEEKSAKDQRKLLLFRGPDDARMAIPLSLVARLEEFFVKNVENVGVGDVVQYRGEILPLIYVREILPERRKELRHPDASDPAKDGNKIQAVVYSDQGHSVGLVVDQILDIVEGAFDLQTAGTRDGVYGTTVIQSRVTELLDIQGIIRKANIDFAGAKK